MEQKIVCFATDKLLRRIIEIWTIQTRERAQLVLIKANRVIEI